MNIGNRLLSKTTRHATPNHTSGHTPGRHPASRRTDNGHQLQSHWRRQPHQRKRLLRRPHRHRLSGTTLRLWHQRPPAVHPQQQERRQRLWKHQVACGLLHRRYGELDLPRHNRRRQGLRLLVRTVVGTIGRLAHHRRRQRGVLRLLRQRRRQRGSHQGLITRRTVQVAA